jgi:hypothetical protein
MSASLLIIVLAPLASIAQAESPEIFIWDVLKRPNYVVAYQKMMSGEKHLPPGSHVKTTFSFGNDRSG